MLSLLAQSKKIPVLSSDGEEEGALELMDG